MYTHTHTHIFHPAVDGHFGCFCILATATNPAVNMECRYGFKIVHLGWITEVGFQDDMAILFSIFRGPPILFSTIDTSTYILTGRVQGFPFLQSCQCCSSFNFLTTATVIVWGGGSLWLICTSLMISEPEHLFIYLSCRGLAPVDPGTSKRGRRQRGSGNNCLIKR